MRAAAILLAAILLAACSRTPEIVRVPSPPRLVSCPDVDPPPLCAEAPVASARSPEALAGTAVEARAWGSACRREVLAWRAGAAECRERMREVPAR